MVNGGISSRGFRGAGRGRGCKVENVELFEVAAGIAVGGLEVKRVVATCFIKNFNLAAPGYKVTVNTIYFS